MMNRPGNASGGPQEGAVHAARLSRVGVIFNRFESAKHKTGSSVAEKKLSFHNLHPQSDAPVIRLVRRSRRIP